MNNDQTKPVTVTLSIDICNRARQRAAEQRVTFREAVEQCLSLFANGKIQIRREAVITEHEREVA